MARHKWDGKAIGDSQGYRGGVGATCKKCGCVKEIIGGKMTYFIDDTLHDGKAPTCDERLLKPKREDSEMDYKFLWGAK